MKILVKYILLIFMFSSYSLFAQTLKIATANDMAPYTFLNSKNEISGLFVDYWLLWSKKTGVKVEFISSSWKKSINNINNSKADIHSGLFKNISREKHIKFLNKIYNVNSSIYVLNNESINTISGLNGKTIGLIKGSYYEEYFSKNYPLINIKTYKTYKEFKKDIFENKIDAFIDDDIISWMNIIRYFDYNKVKKIDNFKLNKWFYVGIKKDDKNLEKIVLDGINNITIRDLIKLEQKWIINKELRVLSNLNTNNILNMEEKIYLKNNPNLALALIKGWKLMSFYNENNEISGFHVDLLKQINKNLKTNIEYKVFNTWTKAYERSKNGEINGIFGLSWSSEREKYFSYSSAYFYTPYYLITRKLDNSIKDIKNLDNKTAIAQKNSIILNIIKRNSPNINIIYSKNQIDNLKKIQNKTADFTIKEDAYEYNLEKYDLHIKKTFFTKEGELFIGTSKKDKVFASIINKGLHSISKQDMNRIKDKWRNKKVTKSIFTKEELLYIKQSPILNVGVEDWKPIIYSNTKNNIDGLAGNILELIFKNSGLKINIINNTWSRLLEDFKNKKIDILPASYLTKDRRKIGLYSDSYLSIKDYLYVKANNKVITSFKDLKGKKIAIIKDYTNVTIVKNKFPDIEIIETFNIEESILKLVNNEVDALYESQIVINNKLNELLLSGLKIIPQDDFEINKIYIFSKKDDLILQSILQKSIYLVSIEEKNKIISKWIKKEDVKKELNILFAKEREPFIFNNSYLKGIEYDLIHEVFKDYQTKINYSNVLFENEYNLFKNNDFFDMAVSIKEKDDEFYYSNDFINFRNVFITRLNENIAITNLNDLEGKKIIAFVDAHKFAGESFFELYNPSKKNNNYREEKDSLLAVKEFLEKKSDILFIDINIFKWHLKYLSDKSILSYKYDYLKHSNNTLQIVFKDKNLKNIFNENLDKIKKSGTYQKIINSYLLYDKKAKIEIISLLSKILSKNIFLDNQKEINNIVKVFSNMPYINKIEIYNENNELLSESSKRMFKESTSFDVFYFTHNFPKKVGFIKIYFNEQSLSSSVSNNNLIPSINKFKNFDSYSDISNIYIKLSYLSNEINFSKKERLFIKNNPIIKFSETAWEPLIFTNNNNVDGLLIDYIKIIEDKTSLNFKYIKEENWLDVIKSFENNELDVLPSYSSLELKVEKSFLSNIYESFNYILITKDNVSFTDDINDLKNNTIALPKNFTVYNLIKTKYPFIKIIETNTIKEAFELVAKNKAYATIEHSAIASYYIKNFFPSLRITGILENKYDHSFLVSQNKPELLSIINKVLNSISFEEKREIRNKWIITKIDTAIDYKILYEVIFVFIVILLIIFYFLNKLKNANKKIQEEKDNFEKFFNDTYDAIVLSKNEKYINANKAILDLFGFTNKEEFLNSEAGSMSPKYQNDGQLSTVKMKKLLETCFEKKKYKYEWLAKKVSGELLYLEIVATSIKINDEYLLHMVCRDITNRKVLEEQIKQRRMDLENSNYELEDSNEKLQQTISNLKETQKKLIESEKMASLGALVAGVAHEINTPIGIGLTGITHLEELTIKINNQYESEMMSQDNFEEYLKTSKDLSFLINKNLEKAASLVRSFKQVAVDQSSEEKRVFNMSEYLDEILQSIHSVTKKSNVLIEINCAKDIKINSFAGAYSQVITNLIMNSLIHGFTENEKGNIFINITKENNKLTIIYKDNGRGIKKENINKIFDPFFTTNRDKGGSGLGLNIIYNIIISTLNGSIKCKSEENKGVEFIIIINI